MLLAIVLLLAGLVILTAGAELMVKGAATVAFRWGISPLVVGLTIVGCGTSAPEMVVSIYAALTPPEVVDGVVKSQLELSIGNILGSNIANVGLVLGIAALIRPIKVTVRTVKKEMPIALAAMFTVWLFAWGGRFDRWEGIILLGGFALFLLYCVRTAKTEAEVEVESTTPTTYPWLFLVLGVIGLVGGAYLFVESATSIARDLGVSDRVIGLSIVAIGTSLPELATSVVATLRGQDDISVGNIIGSIMFNSLLVLGSVATIAPDDIASTVANVDVPVMVGVTLASFPLMWLGFDINRLEGAAILLMYITYMTWVGYTELVTPKPAAPPGAGVDGSGALVLPDDPQEDRALAWTLTTAPSTA